MILNKIIIFLLINLVQSHYCDYFTLKRENEINELSKISSRIIQDFISKIGSCVIITMFAENKQNNYIHNDIIDRMQKDFNDTIKIKHEKLYLQHKPQESIYSIFVVDSASSYR